MSELKAGGPRIRSGPQSFMAVYLPTSGTVAVRYDILRREFLEPPHTIAC